jgi:hypothetical protein
MESQRKLVSLKIGVIGGKRMKVVEVGMCVTVVVEGVVRVRVLSHGSSTRLGPSEAADWQRRLQVPAV